jgi:ABC-type cobalamin/Fe3+-siderophores transport system ATPase subunit
LLILPDYGSLSSITNDKQQTTNNEQRTTNNEQQRSIMGRGSNIKEIQHVDNVILSQKQPFTPDRIAMLAKCQFSRAYLRIRELTAMGKIRTDHKDGKRIFYGVVDAAGQQVLRQSKDIMSLTPAERFQYIGYVTDMVINKFAPSTLILGTSGVGKTFLVKSRFKANKQTEGTDFHTVTGHSTPMGLYAFLHNHRNATIVFDDCDSVFSDATSLNILKSALDSYDVRKVCWNSMRLPEELEPSFEFEGSIIFISNLDSSKVDAAVLSRTLVIDLQMSRAEISEHLKSLVGVIEPKMSPAEKLEVLDYIDTMRDAMENYNIRTFIKACRIRKSTETNGADWRKMILVLS